MSTRYSFIEEHEKAIKYYRATHMRGIIHQIKTMINSTVSYSVYACVNDPTKLTILSRVIALLNEKNLSREITMTVKPDRGGYFIEVHPIQFCEW